MLTSRPWNSSTRCDPNNMKSTLRRSKESTIESQESWSLNSFGSKSSVVFWPRNGCRAAKRKTTLRPFEQSNKKYWIFFNDDHHSWLTQYILFSTSSIFIRLIKEFLPMSSYYKLWLIHTINYIWKIVIILIIKCSHPTCKITFILLFILFCCAARSLENLEFDRLSCSVCLSVRFRRWDCYGYSYDGSLWILPEIFSCFLCCICLREEYSITGRNKIAPLSFMFSLKLS